MKAIVLTCLTCSFLATASLGFPSETLTAEFSTNPLIGALAKTLAEPLERHIKAALEGRSADEIKDTKSFSRHLDLDGPALPSRVRINITLDDIYHYGVGDIVPDIDVDLLRLSLRANYKLPQFKLQGGYSIQIHSNFNPEEAGSREWLVLSGDSPSSATVLFSDLELDVQAKLKWTLLGGFKVDTLDYALSPFGLQVEFPSLRVMEGLLDASNVINPVLTRMLLKELWSMENDYHEPLMTAIRDFIDWLLKGGLIG